MVSQLLLRAQERLWPNVTDPDSERQHETSKPHFWAGDVTCLVERLLAQATLKASFALQYHRIQLREHKLSEARQEELKFKHHLQLLASLRPA